MSIKAERVIILAAGIVALVFSAAPASAQASREAVLNVLVECAKIDDPTARLACYDNNIRNAGGVLRNTVPGRVRVQGGGAPLAQAEGPEGFGREDLKNGAPYERGGPRVNSIRPKVTAIVERAPGIYMFTLEDGAQWVFTHGMTISYRVPRVGSIVEIERGAIGSFLMRFDGQESVPVQRVR
jgi:hypothetical protein